MQVKVRIPSALRSHTDDITEIEVEAGVVSQAVRRLEERFPSLASHLRDESGALLPRVGIYVNDEHVRYRDGLDTPLRDGDTVYVVPIIMGG